MVANKSIQNANAEPNRKVIAMNDIVKSYMTGEQEIIVLKGIDLDVSEGEFISILGPSGSGKSTMMNIIGCLDTPTSGRYKLTDRIIADLTEKELSRIRAKEIGFIFQSFQLLPRLTAAKNIELSMIYSGYSKAERKERARITLERVGLGDKLNNYPNQLSGGQQQRVAIARALAPEPTILLADEPTGALDQKTGHQILDLFKELNEEGRTIIMITHDNQIAKNATRIVNLYDGNLYEGELDKERVEEYVQ